MKKFLSNYYLIILTIVVGILTLIFQFGFQLNLVSLILIHSCAAIFVVITVVSMIKELIEGHVGLDILALTSIISTLFVNDTINRITIEGYWACLMIMIMMASGQALESFSSRKANKELTELINKTPKVVHLLTDSGYCMDIDIKEAKIGDLFLIKPNETVPLDSTITDGTSTFNMSSLTGESIPESKKVGDKILSGFINGNSPIIARVDKKDADSQYQTIVKLAKEVDKKPSKFVKMTDKLAIPFTIVSYLLAGLGWLIAYITNPSISLMDGFTRFVEVLVVASPCPLLLAAPIAMISGISQAYKKNILIKDPIAFEKLANTKTFAFDKTGTLTIGKPSISKIETIDDYSKDDLLLYMASLEINSNHIFAKSIIESSKQTNLLKASDIKEYPGKGVEGFIDGVKYKVGNRSFVSLDDNIEKGETLVGLSVNDNPVGYIIFRDKLKKDTKEALSSLRDLNVNKIIMLTGDNEKTASRIAEEAGIDKYYSSLSPQDKLNIITSISDDDRPIAMVGDGINDTPCLANADIGIAMQSGNDGAISEVSDIIILNDSIDSIVLAKKISINTLKIGRQAVLIGITTCIILMIVAAFGVLPAIIGAICQEGIDLISKKIMINMVGIYILKEKINRIWYEGKKRIILVCVSAGLLTACIYGVYNKAPETIYISVSNTDCPEREKYYLEMENLPEDFNSIVYEYQGKDVPLYKFDGNMIILERIRDIIGWWLIGSVFVGIMLIIYFILTDESKLKKERED